MSFQLYGANEHLPEVRGRTLASGFNFKEGALLVVNGSGEYAECGADPTAIAAVALSDAGTGSGPLYPIGSKEFPPGEMQGVLVEGGTLFTAEYAGTVGTVGTNYGVTRGGDSVWRVDFAKTGGDARVVYIGRVQAGPNNGTRVIVRVLAANAQPA